MNCCCPSAQLCVKRLFTCYSCALSIMRLLQQNTSKCAQGSTLMIRPRIVLTTVCHLGCLDCSLSVISFLCSHMMLFHSLLLITPVSDRGYGQIKRTCYGQINQKVLPLPHEIVDASDQDVSLQRNLRRGTFECLNWPSRDPSGSAGGESYGNTLQLHYVACSLRAVNSNKQQKADSHLNMEVQLFWTDSLRCESFLFWDPGWAFFQSLRWS